MISDARTLSLLWYSSRISSCQELTDGSEDAEISVMLKISSDHQETMDHEVRGSLREKRVDLYASLLEGGVCKKEEKKKVQSSSMLSSEQVDGLDEERGQEIDYARRSTCNDIIKPIDLCPLISLARCST